MSRFIADSTRGFKVTGISCSRAGVLISSIQLYTAVYSYIQQYTAIYSRIQLYTAELRSWNTSVSDSPMRRTLSRSSLCSSVNYCDWIYGSHGEQATWPFYEGIMGTAKRATVHPIRQWRTQEFFSAGVSTNSVEDRENGSPHVRSFRRQLQFGTRNFISYSKIFLIFGTLRLFMMTTNVFVIANVKQLWTYLVLEFYCLFSEHLGVLAS